MLPLTTTYTLKEILEKLRWLSSKFDEQKKAELSTACNHLAVLLQHPPEELVQISLNARIE